ncbi:MAG: SDR family oxidoreductase [Gammaproteobacteria bacterium AqS3]|nr:SDR family oxidoreductase [Gammaproteobacteria bacterium AqS3]
MSQENNISGKIVMITGASSGIGARTAEVLIDAGAKVLLVARREDRLRELAEKLGDAASYSVADVCDIDALKAAVASGIERHGHIDALVNNAGIMPLSPLASGRTEEWSQMIDVNIKGVLYGIHAVLGHLVERKRGHIINISSMAGLRVSPAGSVYSATKFAVRAISDGLRQEHVGDNLRVTTIYPGAFNSELPGTIKDEATLEALRARFGGFEIPDPDGVAEAVAYVIGAPDEVSVSQLVVKPTAQPF